MVNSPLIRPYLLGGGGSFGGGTLDSHDMKQSLIFTPDPGEMIQFDDSYFSNGWFNHQLEPVDCFKPGNI